MCVIAGVIIGILLRFGLPGSFFCTDSSAEFIFSRQFVNSKSCAEGDVLEIGEVIQISSHNADSGGGDSFLCAVEGKVFRDQEGNYIRETVRF